MMKKTPNAFGAATDSPSFQAQRFECFLDVREVDVERAKAVDFFGRKFRCDLGFGFDVVGKCSFAFPCFHGSALDGFVGGLALRAGAGEREQDRLAVIETFGERQVLFHPFRINLEALDEVAQLDHHEVEQDA